MHYIYITLLLQMLISTGSIASPLNNCIHFDQLYVQDSLKNEEEQLKSIFNTLKNAYDSDYEAGVITPAIENLSTEKLPKWAENNPQKFKEYHQLHAETLFDRFLGYIATRLGIIIHGQINQDELAEHLSNFDIQRLLVEGPYQNELISLEAQKLIYDSFSDVSKIYDLHIHNLGYDEGNYLNPRAGARYKAKWKDYFTFLVLRYASGISSTIGSTQDARERIHLYASHFPKLSGYILPIHKAIRPDGSVDWENTGSFLKNKAAWITATTFESTNAGLQPAVSVHPFDTKWKRKLHKAHAKGIRLVKWMPPQSIPPDSELLDEYYDTLKELNMTIIAHSGPEHVIPTTDENRAWQDWGNPLRFRSALSHGVNVILAHSGHKELIPDIDHPDRPLVPGYKLFIRLAKEAHKKNLSGEWVGKVYGDLAAVATHYGPEFVKEIMSQIPEDGVRFIYGSDYPYTNLIKPRQDAYDLFAENGLINKEKVKSLKEIRAWNPLLANYVFTRQLQLINEEGNIISFPLETFTGDFPGAELDL